MTHDELLARIDNVTYAHDKSHTIDKDRIVKQLNGLRAVVERHYPMRSIYGITSQGQVWDKVICNACSSDYPCADIQAIEKELG